MPETALICRVPEAERYIAHYRQRFDPSARRNVPAHVTILYPFMAPELVDAGVLATLAGHRGRRCPASTTAWRKRVGFRLRSIWRPDPDASFAALIAGVFRAFPDFPPFEGKFDTVVPHVTVAHGDEPLLCEIEVELRIALPGAGVAARCSELVLIENSSGRWEQMHVFALKA